MLINWNDINRNNVYLRRAAVEQCPEDEEESLVSEGEEKRKIREAQAIKVKQLIGSLKDKDRQLAAVLEDKMSTFCELVELLANNEDGASWNLFGSESATPKYGHLLEQGFHSAEAKQMLAQVRAVTSVFHSFKTSSFD